MFDVRTGVLCRSAVEKSPIEKHRLAKARSGRKRCPHYSEQKTVDGRVKRRLDLEHDH